MKITEKFPANLSCDACVDTELILTFDCPPVLTGKGYVKVSDYSSGEVVDFIDFGVPAGPVLPRNCPQADYLKKPYVYESGRATNKNTVAGTPSAGYPRDEEKYQLTIIGGFSDGFHFYPAFTEGNSLHIQLHHNLLEQCRKYFVLIGGVVEGFGGINDKNEWVFTTGKVEVKGREITVAIRGGNFMTVQGALDFIPDHADKSNAYTVRVKNGDYRELVYFRNKDYVSIIGESMDKVIVHYANNEVFNPHPALIKTNERPGTFPSRRAAFAIDNCTHITLKNLTVKNDAHGQAEGLLVNGSNNRFERVHIIGSGDALQTNGSALYENCIIDGEGDTVLGRGPAFFRNTVLNSRGPFMWIRNTRANHGNVFVNCVFNGEGENAVIARLPDNNGMQYPDAECVLINCVLCGVPPIGFYPIDEKALGAHLCEFNSRDKEGEAIDLSRRHPSVKILRMPVDEQTIKNYSDCKFVLGADFDL